jgi:hypothetical protein
MSIEKALKTSDPELDYIDYHKDLPRLLAYATTHADVEDLLSLTDGGSSPRGRSFGTRRAFCEAVGIGESTLAGWLKEQRLPPLARAVVGLLHLYHSNLISNERSVAYEKRDEIVVKDGDSFMIVVSGGPNRPGKIAARNIPDQETAFRLISAHELRYALKLALDLLAPSDQGGAQIDPELLEYLEGLIPQTPEFAQEVLNFVHKDVEV